MVSNFKRLMVWIGLTVAFSMILASCGGKEEPSPVPTSSPPPTATRPVATATLTAVPATATPVKPKRGGTIRTYQTRNIDGQLDFHASQNSTTWVDASPLLNWVVELDQLKGKIGPDLAQSWDVSTDGLTYTFHLVRNAFWHDGKPVTADDIIYTVDRITGKLDLKAPTYKATFASVTNYRKVDDFTVEFTLKNPSATFLTALGVIGNMIYPKHVPITEFAAFRPIGSGPFVWGSYQPDISVTLNRNGKYWKKDQFGDTLPYLDAIQIFIIPDTVAALAAFQTGQIDVSFPHTANEFTILKKEVEQKVPGVQWVTYASRFTIYFRNAPPFTDQRLRTALHLAIDRQAAASIWVPGSIALYLNSAPGGVWALSNDEINQIPGYRQPKDQDIAEAKRLLSAALADAGLTLDSWKPTLKALNVLRIPDIVTIATNQWKQNLGLVVSITPVDRPTSIQLNSTGAFELYAEGASGALDDPSQTMEPYVRTGGGINFGKFTDPEVDKALDEIERTLDFAKRKQLSQALERKLVQLAWQPNIVAEPKNIAVRPEVRNYWRLFGQDNHVDRHEITWLDR